MTANLQTGSLVKATVPESMEYDRAEFQVEGILEIRHIEAFGGYNQYWVNGWQVEPSSIRPLNDVVASLGG